MANINQILVVISIWFVGSSWLPVSDCVKKPMAGARKEDIPYINCQVCEKLAMQLHQQVQKKQAQISPKKISEYQIIEIAENVCNLKKEEADWILRIDIVEKGDELELIEQDAEGDCNSECKTIERTCQEVIGYSDTDVAEHIYKFQPDIASLVSYLCKDLTKACSKKPPPVPKDRVPGEAFVVKPAKDAEMEKILKSMEGMPGSPGMKMYSREELMNMKIFGNEDADDDEDDEEEPNFPPNLKKVLQEKESKKDDWKERITERITDTRDGLKSHASKVSNRLRGWWRRMKASSSKNLESKKVEL